MMSSSKKYKLVYSRYAKKDLSKIDSVSRTRIGKKILFLSNNPTSYARGLRNVPEIGEYRWRVGQYRATFNMKGNSIHILRIRHRKDVYKR